MAGILSDCWHLAHQPNAWLAFTPCASATRATDAPGFKVSSTIRQFSPTGHRRLCGSLLTTARSEVSTSGHLPHQPTLRPDVMTERLRIIGLICPYAHIQERHGEPSYPKPPPAIILLIIGAIDFPAASREAEWFEVNEHRLIGSFT
jgi:hypothetical protein